MQNLIKQQCQSCQVGSLMLTDQECRHLIEQIPEWTIVEHHSINRLERVFEFKNFLYAIEFTDKVAAIAEEQAHHPAILTERGKVTVTWWTHKIKGLHQNDFICAAKTDELICAGLKL